MDLLNVDNESDQKMTWYKVKEMNYRGLLANDRKKKWFSFSHVVHVTFQEVSLVLNHLQRKHSPFLSLLLLLLLLLLRPPCKRHFSNSDFKRIEATSSQHQFGKCYIPMYSPEPFGLAAWLISSVNVQSVNWFYLNSKQELFAWHTSKMSFWWDQFGNYQCHSSIKKSLRSTSTCSKTFSKRELFTA